MRAASFDIETRYHSSTLPNGWRDVLDGRAGCSAFVCWTPPPGRAHIFDENTLSEGVSLLEDVDVVLSYNGVSFDVPVLEAMMGRKLALRQHLDLFHLIKDALYTHGLPPRGYKLGELGERTIGIGKTGDGADAPALAERGLWASLFDYCLSDAFLTYHLFKFAQKHGGVISLDGDLLPLNLPDWFKDAEI